MLGVMFSAIVMLSLATSAIAAPLTQSSNVAACGTLIAYAPPSADRPIGGLQINEAGGKQVEFAVRLPGTVTPSDINAIGTALSPITVAFHGSRAADGVVTSFDLRRVERCEALPSTSTSVQPSDWAIGLFIVAMSLVLLPLKHRRRELPGVPVES